MLGRPLSSFVIALATVLALSACGGDGGSKAHDAAVADLPGDLMANPCQLSGGACVGVSQCGPGQGYLSTLGGVVGCNSSDGNTVCCYASCGGTPAEFPCCATGATFRPSCNPTTMSLMCPSGTTPCGDDGGTSDM